LDQLTNWYRLRKWKLCLKALIRSSEQLSNQRQSLKANKARV
jgi:hypothetical protein